MLATPTPQEQTAAADWSASVFHPAAPFDPKCFPVSFRYDGQDSLDLLKDWQAAWTPPEADSRGVTRQSLVLTDPHSNLQCRCEITTFADFPAIEWVVYFKNTGSADTAIVSDIQPLDASFTPAQGSPMCWLHYSKGSQCHLDDFEPLRAQLTTRSETRLAALRGRSSNGTLPFFDLDLGGDGIIGAIGWTGGWAANFHRGADGAVRVRTGLENTHLKLHPGEEIRTPRILLLFWQQDRLHGHNLLRQFILAHHTPRPNGELLQAPISDTHWGDRTEQHQIAKAHWLRENNLPAEYFWIDADWYGDAPHNEDSDTFGREWYQQVGNWFPRKSVYPNGLKPIGDALRSLNLGFVLWVEPERAYKGTQIVREHPEWLLGPVGDNYLFNLGIPEARRYLTDLISQIITEGGVTCYRQDFNMDPAPFWQAADRPDRVGISEIRHIEGLYAFWDELLARHPGLIIDNCSSGGRRIDLETTSRSIPLWRSDVQCYPGFAATAMQNQTQGLASWIPLSTGCVGALGDTYSFRSALGPGIVFSWSETGLRQGDDFPIEWCREMLAELKEVRPYFYGDFYPLVSFSLADDAWAAWQFDRPDLGEGMVLAFRRPSSPFPRLESPLRGLNSDATYEIYSHDHKTRERRTGRDLIQRGVTIAINEAPGSELVTYKRI